MIVLYVLIFSSEMLVLSYEHIGNLFSCENIGNIFGKYNKILGQYNLIAQRAVRRAGLRTIIDHGFSCMHPGEDIEPGEDRLRTDRRSGGTHRATDDPKQAQEISK